MPDINTVSVTFHDERKREEYGPMKKAEATITAAVSAGEDGAAVLDQIAFIATNKVRAMLSLEGATRPEAAASPTAPQAEAAPPAKSPDPQPQAPPPINRVRRTADEVARGLTVEQAAAERAVKAALRPESLLQIDPENLEGVAAAGPSESQAASSVETAPVDTGNEWDTAAPVEITDAELNQACAEAASRCGDPLKVRGMKEPYNPNPGQPFSFINIPQQHRAEVLAKLKAL